MNAWARETGQFNDTLGDGSRWLAHFDTTADFPAVVARLDLKWDGEDPWDSVIASALR